jgi:hypothetical protein
MRELIAFVYPAAKQTLLAFVGANPEVLENVEQQAPTD